jgi:hypothetical protein
MNFPRVMLSASSPRPALELIALAQLSPSRARQRLRALLLTNPNYFEKIPPASLSAVLNIQEDTAYECISRLSYDLEPGRICAAIHVKQSTGYSSEMLFQGSKEFVRFYQSYDGGSKWQDLGMRFVTVADAHRSEPLGCEVTLAHTSANEPIPTGVRRKIRAILSWNSPPPVGEPSWKPVGSCGRNRSSFGRLAR